MKILLAHPGTQHSSHLALALHQRDSLLSYCTGLSLAEGSVLAHFLPTRLRTRRMLAGIPAAKLALQPWLEMSAYFLKVGMDSRRIHQIRNSIFQRNISSRLMEKADAIIGFDTSSWILAKRAIEHDKKFFVEMTTPHPAEKEKVVNLLRERYPSWVESTLSINNRVEDIEATVACCIVVPSNYVKESYVRSGVPELKIKVNPYGVNVTDFTLKKFVSKRKIRFLFLGSLTAAKGVPLLLDAWRSMDVMRAELFLAGYGKFPPDTKLPEGVTFLGRIERKDRRELFHSSDVFICPSFYEGLALVQLEAAISGLPVIGTTSSGASDVLIDGKSGFIIESGSIQQLIERMFFFVEHPDAIQSMGLEAHLQATCFTWKAYADRWIELVRDQND